MLATLCVHSSHACLQMAQINVLLLFLKCSWKRGLPLHALLTLPCISCQQAYRLHLVQEPTGVKAAKVPGKKTNRSAQKTMIKRLVKKNVNPPCSAQWPKILELGLVLLLFC